MGYHSIYTVFHGGLRKPTIIYRHCPFHLTRILMQLRPPYATTSVAIHFKTKPGDCGFLLLPCVIFISIP